MKKLLASTMIIATMTTNGCYASQRDSLDKQQAILDKHCESDPTSKWCEKKYDELETARKRDSSDAAEGERRALIVTIVAIGLAAIGAMTVYGVHSQKH